MNLTLKDIRQTNDFEAINSLYHRAFPDAERMPISMMMEKLETKDADFYVIYDDELLVGMVYTITYHDLSYINYFAIEDNLRGKGYGSKTLQLLQIHYKHTIMLCVEEVDEKYDNYKERFNRKNFYLRNGLKEMGFYFNEANVHFEMLYYGIMKSAKDYDQLIIDFIGEKYKEIRVYEDDKITGRSTCPL